MGLLIDLIPNSPTNIMRIVWQTVRRIYNEILGVKGLNVRAYHESSITEQESVRSTDLKVVG